MHEDLEKAYRLTDEKFGAQLAACDRVHAYAYEITNPWTGRPLDREGSPHDLLVAALFARAFNTYWSAVELARMGFGEQAAMLNRSLFEDMVDIHWVCTEPERALELYEQHHEHSRMLLADQVAKYPDWYPDLELPEFDQEERKRLDGVFGSYGTKSWTTLSLHDRVTAIEHHWENDHDREALRFFRDIPHRENNQTLHVSAHGLGSLVLESGPDAFSVRLGPGTSMVDRSLFGSYWMFSQIVGLMIDHFNVAIDAQERAELLAFDAFVTGAGANASKS